MKLISVVTPCYNEEENVEELCRRVKQVFAGLEDYDYEHIFIDNASTDRTLEILKHLAAEDRHIKIIVNTRNFGHIRSPYHAYLQAHGDAVIAMAGDLQDPPEMIVDLLQRWEAGYKIVVAVKAETYEAWPTRWARRTYYRLVSRLSEVELVQHFTGFGLYDWVVIQKLREIDDPYPYFRGLICDLGYERAEITYSQPRRARGLTKNNFYTLWDMAMLGITNHSKVPLRLAIFTGFIVAGLSLLVALGYLLYKILNWDSFQVGMAPLVIGIYFLGAVQLIFIGILGEYIGSIHTQVLKRPLVIEKERINFD
ncbi:MAG: glycosyltransferase family 2 protein [candidate division WS1 bacterium]|nr:glycosyltransferase family 2 protein [candidate division WS1 bacterium]